MKKTTTKSKATKKKTKKTIYSDKSPPSISTMDQKILWGRAAARCSMEDCRMELTLEKADGDSATIGEMAHIVGEKKPAARGNSPLSLDERNRYFNLILLCRNHHIIIDEDAKGYPIELLHRIKTDHETWVVDVLSGPSKDLDPDELVYSNLIDTITTELSLDSWEWFVDNAVRDLVHERFVDVRGNLNCVLLGTIWPGKRRALENKIRALIKAFDNYISHFVEGAEPRGEWLKPDNSFKRSLNSQYHKYAEQQDRWSRKSFWLLCDYVVKLNAYSDAVRRWINPMYFRLYGCFLIHDNMGVLNRGQPIVYSPEANVVKKNLTAISKSK